jgi:hypothetical protein
LGSYSSAFSKPPWLSTTWIPPDFEVPQQPDLLGDSGLSQEFDAASLLEEVDSQTSLVAAQDFTPNTSLSQGIDEGAFKKWHNLYLQQV